MLESNVPEQSEINTQGAPKPDSMNMERNQPDPTLDMSERRMGNSGFSLVAVAIVVMLAIVFFGLNGRSETNMPAQPIPLASR